MLVLSGCGESGAPGDGESPPVTWSYESTQSRHPICDDADSDNGCMSVRYAWPRFEGGSPALVDSLNRAMSRFFFETDTASFRPVHFDSLAGLWFTMYDSVRVRVPGYSLPWEEQKQVAVLYRHPEWISLSFVSRQFTGGAHPLTERHYRSYDTRSGRRLGVEELFLDERAGALPLLVESHFRRYHNIPLEASLADSGFYFEDTSSLLTDNLALLSDGLLIYFNPYEVAPYARGPTRLLLPRAEIDSLLRPAYRLAPAGR